MHNACESTSWPATAVCDPINMFKQNIKEISDPHAMFVILLRRYFNSDPRIHVYSIVYAIQEQCLLDLMM